MAYIGQDIPTKETGYNIHISNLHHSIDNLKDKISCLAIRVEPLLNPCQPCQPEKKLSQPTQQKAKILNDIDSFCSRILELQTIVNEMIERIEI